MIVVMMITAKEKIAKIMNEILKLSDASSFILSNQSLPHSFAFSFAVH